MYNIKKASQYTSITVYLVSSRDDSIVLVNFLATYWVMYKT